MGPYIFDAGVVKEEIKANTERGRGGQGEEGEGKRDRGNGEIPFFPYVKALAIHDITRKAIANILER